MPSHGNSGTRGTDKYATSRRHLLRAGIIGGATTLAGCSGDQSGNASGTNGGTSGGSGSTASSSESGNSKFVPRDNSFAEPTTDDPTNWQFNVYNFTKSFLHENQNDMFHRYHIGRDEFSSYAISVDSYEGTKAVLKVRDGLTWHNGDPGDPVTSKDLYTKLVCEEITNATLAKFWTDLKIVGDKKVEITLDGTVNERLFQEALNNYWLETPHRKYRQFVEAWEDAGSDKARQAVRSDLRSATFDQPHGNGPFQFDSRSGNRYRMKKYPHHPDADQINWEYWDLERVSSDTASVMLGMEVDAIRNYTPPEAVLKGKPDALETAFVPALWGHSLPFNNDHEDFGNIRVRQAITEFIDRGACANNYGQFGQPTVAPSGLIGNIDNQNKPSDNWQRWVSDEGVQSLHRYNNPERGRRLLREQGYEKRNGKWFRPDGTRLEMPIKVPSEWTDWLPVYRTIVGTLNKEGIKSSLVTIDPTAYWPDHYLAGNYVAAATGWTLQHSHPYYNFDMYYNMDAGFLNLNVDEIEVPPFGEPDGELQSVDVPNLMEELRLASGEQETELIDQLAWITNQSLPMLPVQEINDTIWFTSDDWEIPPTDDPIYQSKWPLWWFPRMGELKAKSK